MLKRQESSLSSSRRQAASATTPSPLEAHHAKAIGCMSGIFQLFSKYQNRNKRLTFGKKQEKSKPISTAKSRKCPPAAKEDNSEKETYDDTKRLTCGINVPRSPTLPPEIRRSNAASADTPENSRTPPCSSLVARLMGFEDLVGTTVAKQEPAAPKEDRFTEKRRRILQALEKCNDDLEALKRIIKTVQTAGVRIQSPLPPDACKMVHPGCGTAVGEETNISAVAAEELTKSPLSCISIVQYSTAGETHVLQQRKPTTSRKTGKNDELFAKLLNKSANNESLLNMRHKAIAAITGPCCSRSMVQSVEEVCGGIAWGEKREIGRIGLVLQDHLCRELVEELVKELESCSIHSLPFESCKRRLRL